MREQMLLLYAEEGTHDKSALLCGMLLADSE